MAAVMMDIAAMIISWSLGFYFLVISVQGLGALINGMLTRSLPTARSLSGLCQNLGIGCALVGLTFQNMELAVVGVLVIALGVVTGPRPTSVLNTVIERALLVAGITSLGCLGVVLYVV
ncbi:MAG: hypothetical protein ACE5JZ_06415 [Kiloniellales bacterium]